MKKQDYINACNAVNEHIDGAISFDEEHNKRFGETDAVFIRYENGQFGKMFLLDANGISDTVECISILTMMCKDFEHHCKRMMALGVKE